MQKNKSRSTERRHHIKVIRTVRSRDSGGFTISTITPSAPYWASVEPLSEKSRLDFQNVSVEASHRIVVDAAVVVEEGDKIEFNGREFLIKTIRRDSESRRDKILITEEIIPGQKKG
jgi:SPP1 family predicted phage head-tail adaptor